MYTNTLGTIVGGEIFKAQYRAGTPYRVEWGEFLAVTDENASVELPPIREGDKAHRGTMLAISNTVGTPATVLCQGGHKAYLYADKWALDSFELPSHTTVLLAAMEPDTYHALSWLESVAGPPSLPLTGGTLTGPLVLSMGSEAAPSLTFSTSANRNTGLYTGSTGATIWAAADGVAILGISNALGLQMLQRKIVQMADPIDPTDATTKQYVDNAIGAIPAGLPLSGGTLTGDLTLAADPTEALHAAPKQYVDAAIAAIPAPPSSGITMVVKGTMDVLIPATMPGRSAVVQTLNTGVTLTTDVLCITMIGDIGSAAQSALSIWPQIPADGVVQITACNVTPDVIGGSDFTLHFNWIAIRGV